MITDAILDVLGGVVYYLIDLIPLPDVGNLSIPDDVFNGLTGFLANVAYIVPVKHVVIILSFSFVLDHFKAIWALFLKLKNIVSF